MLYVPDTHLDVPMNVIIYPFRVRHILQHDIAYLKGCFAKANLEKLDRTNLISFSLYT